LSTLLEPPIAAVLAALLFNEALTIQTIAGGVAILAAVAITLRETGLSVSSATSGNQL
jgi:drug/metabolite transporter (DMT)-like permease